MHYGITFNALNRTLLRQLCYKVCWQKQDGSLLN